MSIVPAEEITPDTILAARAGDRRAGDRVARALLNGSVGRVRAASAFLLDVDEAQSLAGVAVMRTIRDFSAECGSIHGQFLNSYKSLVCNSQKRRARKLRWDSQFAVVAPSYLADADDDRELEDDIVRMRIAAAALPERQRSAFAALAGGKSTADIAREMRISRQSAHRLCVRVIENLGRALGARAAA